MTQLALWCACGNPLPRISRLGALCAICLRRRRLSLEKFDGEREAAFARDGYACQVCGGIDDLICHHRPRGFASLCRGDHARAHHLRRLRYTLPERLKLLWKELHRKQTEQLEFSFNPAAAAVQLPLEDARKPFFGGAACHGAGE